MYRRAYWSLGYLTPVEFELQPHSNLASEAVEGIEGSQILGPVFGSHRTLVS